MKLRNRSRLVGLMAATASMALAFGLAGAPAQADEPAPANTLKVDFDAEGVSRIGANVDADLPLGPTVLKSELDTTNGAIVGGSLDIPSQVLNFDILGIPARSTVTLEQVGSLTGQITPVELGKSVLESNVSYTIGLSDVEVRVFGIWWPLAVGSNCRTAEPVDISARTPDGEFFTLAGGGRVTGTYSIGIFKGCAALNFADIPGFFPWFGSVPINAIVSGNDHTLDLTISNPRFGGV